jgi:hypothetical protein
MTLFGNPFYYVPWTAIVHHTGLWGLPLNPPNPLINVLDVAITPQTSPATTPIMPTPSNTNLVVRYYYSVCGKNLYINYCYKHSGNPSSVGTAGTSSAYYYKIPSQFHSSLSPMLYSSENLTANTPGTRLGSGIFHAYNGGLDFGTVYYSTLNNGTPSLLFYREQTSWGPHSPSNFAYSIHKDTGFWFEAIVPLA